MRKELSTIEALITLLFTVALILGVIVVKVWFWGSLLTSSVKAVSGSCQKTYGIESIPLINGNWFCSEE